MGDTLIAWAPMRGVMEAGGSATLVEENRNVECTCPHEVEYHSWRLIHTDLVPLGVKEAYQLVFVHEKFMLDVLAARKCYKYVATAWAPDPEGSGHCRTITYHMPLVALARNASVTDTQVLSNLNRAGEVYAVACEVSNEGVPMGDSFSIQLHVCLLRAAPPEDEVTSGTSRPTGDWCRYSCYAQMKYKKNVWNMLKGQLERAAFSGMEGVHREVVEALRGHVSRGTGRMVTAQSARHKRRRKTASTDLTQRMRMDALRQGSNKKPKSSDWSLFVNTCFIAMLVTSFFINAWLYHRVRMLEILTSKGRPGDDPVGSWSRRLIEPEEGDLSGLRRTFKSMNEGVWGHVASVLHQQERAYLSELHNMAGHLLHASHALGQADAEIHTVLRQLPVIQEELVNSAKRDLQRRVKLGEETKQLLEEKQFIKLEQTNKDQHLE